MTKAKAFNEQVEDYEAYGYPVQQHSLASIAISLKRIADILERLEQTVVEDDKE